MRNTIGRMESPRRDLSFEQLKIYYETRGLHLNDPFMKKLLTNKQVAYTIPEKPNSRLQQYRLTSLGLAKLKNIKEDRSGGL